jgi:hypothetical protein
MKFTSGLRPIRHNDVAPKGVPIKIGRETFSSSNAASAILHTDKEFQEFVRMLPSHDGKPDLGELSYKTMLDAVTKMPATRDRFVAAAIRSVKERFARTQVTPENQAAWNDLHGEARVFHIRYMADLSKMIENYPKDSSVVHVAPFPIFKIKLDQEYSHAWHAPDDELAMDITGIVPLEWIVDARSTPWMIYGRNRIVTDYQPEAEDEEIYRLIRDGVAGKYNFELIDGPMPFDPETGAVDDDMLVTVGSVINIKTERPAVNISSSHVARAFCAFINHESLTATTMVDPDRPPNRQQRRASNYAENPHYRIVIRGRLERIAKELAEGKHIRERREHDVRQHMRRNRAGVKAIRVRPHRRCRGVKEFIQREYEAAVEYTPDA